MTATSPQQPPSEFFTSPAQLNQRRYEALRAHYVDGLSYAEAGRRFGYTRWTMIDLARQHRAGKLDLFSPPGRPGRRPGAPRKDAVRARVIELRREGLSTYEISARLGLEGTPLNRTSVAEILAEEGFGRLLRRPEPARSISPATPGRDTKLPRAKLISFATWPERLDTVRAGLLLVLPDLVAFDLPGLVRAAGYPGTAVIPALNWLLSLLSLKLTRTRRVSHVDDLLADPAAGLLAGMAVLPKKSALTDYSYRLSHDHQRAFLAALDTTMISAGLASSDQAIFDLDVHAVMHWGHDPVLEKHYVPKRSQRARSVLTSSPRIRAPTTWSTPTRTSPKRPRPKRCSRSVTTGRSSRGTTRTWSSWTRRSPPTPSWASSTPAASSSSPSDALAQSRRLHQRARPG
jgi:transposase